MFLSANTSTLHITILELGNLFYVRYRSKSLKYGLLKYPTCISFIVPGMCDFQDLIYICLLGQIFLNYIIGIDQICLFWWF